MSRFSPTVAPYAGPDFQNTLAQAIGAIRRQKYDRIQDEQRQRSNDLADFELYQQGGRRFDEAPTVEQPIDQTVFAGQHPSMVPPAQQPAVPSIFRGQNLGGGSQTDVPPLAAEIGGLRAAAATRPDFLPGQFVPGAGFAPHAGFTPPSLFAGGIQAAGPVAMERPDPRYTHISGDVYYDTQDNPTTRTEAAQVGREERAHQYRESELNAAAQRVANQKARLEQALAAAGVDPARAHAAALGASGDQLPYDADYDPALGREGAEIRAGYRETPGQARAGRIKEHEANRAFDVKNPIPGQYGRAGGITPTAVFGALQRRAARALDSVVKLRQTYEYEKADPQTRLRMEADAVGLWGFDSAAAATDALTRATIAGLGADEAGEDTGRPNITADSPRRSVFDFSSGPSFEDVSGSAPDGSAAGDRRPTITRDQAAFLRQRKGWTDAQISATYTVK